jgi:hypothetical protein
MALPVITKELIKATDAIVQRVDGQEWFARQGRIIEQENPMAAWWIKRMMYVAEMDGYPSSMVEATAIGLYHLLRAQGEADELEYDTTNH